MSSISEVVFGLKFTLPNFILDLVLLWSLIVWSRLSRGRIVGIVAAKSACSWPDLEACLVQRLDFREVSRSVETFTSGLKATKRVRKDTNRAYVTRPLQSRAE